MGDVASPAYPGYPAAPSQQQGALSGDPMRLIGALREIQDYQIRQQQAPALAQQPAATLRGTNISNVTAQQEQDAQGMSIAGGAYGALSNLENPTADDVHNRTAWLSTATHIPSDRLNAISDQILKDPKGIKHGAANFQATVMGPGAATSRVTAPPGPGGVPQTMPAGAATIAGTLPTGQAPGEAEAQIAAAERGSRLQATAATTSQYHADLDNLKQDSKILGNLGGPTADVEKKLNQLSTRVAGFGVTMTPDQLKAAESFDKIANQISLNQSTMFHGSDAGLHTVVGANPSTSMSAYGREGVIDMLHGNQDAIDRARNIWLDARAKGAPASSYDTFMNQLSQKLDPRVFQFNRLSRDNQQKFLGQMDPEDLGDFEKKYQDAIAAKWVKPLKKAPNAAQ